MPSPRKSAHASPTHSAEDGLADHELWEPLLEYVLPHLRLVILGHLRASCRFLQSLLDSEHCHDIWFAAAWHLLPRSQQMPMQLQAEDSLYAYSGSDAQKPQGPPDSSSNITPQQQQRQQLQPITVPNTALPCRMREQTADGDATAADRPEQQQQQQQQQQLAPTTLQIGHNEQQHPGDCQATHLGKASSEISFQDVQSRLRAQAAFLRGLAETPSLIRLPANLDGDWSIMLELWSPCGVWVAMQRRKLQYALSHGTTSLIIWDTVSLLAQEVDELPDKQIFDIAWLPASSWLLCIQCLHWAWHAPRLAVCFNVATGERHEHREGFQQVCTRQGKASIAATGKMMAYFHGTHVMLHTLPLLKHQHTLSNPMRDIPSDASAHGMSLSFNPSGSHIAVCWARYIGPMSDSEYHLEIFDTVTGLLCLSMPTMPSQQISEYSWSPAGSHLLITDSHMLDLTCNPVKCKHLDMGQTDAQPSPLAWTADGSMAVILTSFVPNCQSVNWSGASPWGRGTAVLCDGTIAEIVVAEISPSVVVRLANRVPTFLLDMPIALQDHLASVVEGYLELYDTAPPFFSGYSSACGRLKVRWQSWPQRCLQLFHVALDLAACSMQRYDMPLSATSYPIWKPSPAATRIYAMVG